ncbi:MAG: UDP-glucose 4-epimerase GalE [Bryobacter sp.]
MSTPHILVAGGAGYIGSHTAKLLSRSGFVPVSFDNLSTGSRDAVRFGPFVEGSIGDPDAVRAALRQYDIAAVILFAGHAYVGESTQNPLKYYQNNLAASFRFLETLREENVTKLVFSSSCSIFGQKTSTPLVEDSPKDPLSPYAETKWFFEKVLHWVDHAHGLRSVSLRYFNAAGADPEGEIGEDHDPETHLIPLTLDAASGGRPLTVFGTDYPTPDGTAIRDYIHVSDLADAHLLALRYLLNGGATTFVNLGTGQGHSVKQVMECVEKIVGAPVEATYGPRREGDAPQLVANPAYAREVLQWEPQHSSLETIVSTAWEWRRRKARA